MRKTSLVLITVSFCLLATTALAGDDAMRAMRRQADSQYRIAQKAYRDAVKKYGESMEGVPDSERGQACRKLSSALHDNRTQYKMESVMEQMKYKRQVDKLESYNTTFGCP